ncbi:MAG TPA: DNA-processing protein DprA [Gemmatimonadaceae bacterium]|nr:DNA-processing protein DprA [Gemmatimonadaceae bacterium]
MIRSVRERPAGAWRTRATRGNPAPTMVRRGETGYPAALEDGDPPRQLWCLGDASLLGVQPMVAIVGTRNSTAYGERTARDLARAIVDGGGCVVSGMARGVDAAAHAGAMEGGGRTIAVLGTGVDVPYPPRHRALHARIAAAGLVISEMPLGQGAFIGCFPRRNRIIAGLASVVVVVEGGHKSGALKTAGIALELGRSVAGVPGPIDSPQSAGVNQLIRDGAHMLTDVGDLLQLAGLDPARRVAYEPAGPDERAVYDALSSGALSPDVLALRTGLPAARCFAAVTALELAGAVECTLGGTVRRR